MSSKTSSTAIWCIRPHLLLISTTAMAWPSGPSGLPSRGYDPHEPSAVADVEPASPAEDTGVAVEDTPATAPPAPPTPPTTERPAAPSPSPSPRKPPGRKLRKGDSGDPTDPRSVAFVRSQPRLRPAPLAALLVMGHAVAQSLDTMSLDPVATTGRALMATLVEKEPKNHWEPRSSETY